MLQLCLMLQVPLCITGRTLYHEGNLLELELVENTVIKTVRGFLFSDSFMIASIINNTYAFIKCRLCKLVFLK